jgi:hypothetical protein
MAAKARLVLDQQAAGVIGIQYLDTPSSGLPIKP